MKKNEPNMGKSLKYEIKKKEPATIHIVKNNAFGIASIQPSDNTQRVDTRKLSGVSSPVRYERQRDKSEFSDSKFILKKHSGFIPILDSKYLNYTNSKERTKEMMEIRTQIEEQKRKDISKVREINKLMKSMGKEEHQNNIKLFQKYNEDEKKIVKSLISKAKEEHLNEKINKRLNIIKEGRRKQKLKSDQKF